MILKRYVNAYSSLTPLKQLVLSFLTHWIYWFIGWLIVAKFVLFEEHSWWYYLLHATWMSVVMTTPFSWKNWKSPFISNGRERHRNNKA